MVASVLVLLAAWWTKGPSAGIAFATLATTVWLGILTWRGRPSFWRRRTAFVVFATMFSWVVTAYEIEIRQLERAGAGIVESRSAAGGAALASAVSAAGEELTRLASRALRAPTDRDAAFDFLAVGVSHPDDLSVLIAEHGRPFAWVGRLVVPVDSLPGPVGVIATPFYIVAYAVAVDGPRFAVASLLIHADGPAAGLSRPLDRRVAAATGVDGFVYGGAGAAADVRGAVVLSLGGEALLAARAITAPPELLRQDAAATVVPRAAVPLAALVLLLLATAWRRDGGLGPRLGALAVGFGALALVPLSALSNHSSLFDPSFYFVGAGGRFTANAGAVAISSGLLLLGLLSAVRDGVRPLSRAQALGGVIVVAGVGPFVLRALAEGIQVPVFGVSAGLWLSWQVTLFLAAVTVLLLGVTAGRAALGGKRGLPAWVAPVVASIAALSTPLFLEAPGRLPPLHPVLWVLAIAALALTRRARAMVLNVAFVAACGAVTLVWFSAVRDRVELAKADVQALGAPDPTAAILLQRYANQLDPATSSRSRVEILSRFAASDLSGVDYPTEIATWSPEGTLMAELRVGRGPGGTAGVNMLAREAQQSRQPILREAQGEPGVHVVLAVPHVDGTATTVVLAPRTALVAPDAFGAFLGLAPPPDPEPPYGLRLGELIDASVESPRGGVWTRIDDELHGEWLLHGSGGLMRSVHATVDLRSFGALVTRGSLLVLIDLAMLGAVWLLIVTADGALRRWWRLRRRDIVHSYRVRLSGALFAAFVVPSALFGIWSFQRVQADDRQSRDLLVRETLRGVAASTDSVELAAASARFDTPLFLYADGLLIGTSDPLLDALSPVGRLLPPGVVRTLAEGVEPTAGREEDLGPAAVRLGYRAATDSAGVQYVLAAPARLDERLLDRRRNDLAVYLLFALALGGIAALWVSGEGSRQLSRPIRALQESALALARGVRPPELTDDPPVEFAPVFTAFRQMTNDLAESRAALMTAERRLAATLRNVASGVVALDGDGDVTFANPRAESILGVSLTAGTELAPAMGSELMERLVVFQEGSEDDDAFEVEREARRLQVRVARLARGERRVVVTLDDVTDVARAERVIAWGEMARQIAHEIKNPLTPIRLGMQHLRRARRDNRLDFDLVLEENTTRVLAEIDRLDEIARAFSRYGAAPVEDTAATAVDVTAVARDVLELERMGAEGITWDADIPEGPILALARERELRDVMLNLLENSRSAHARRISLVVALLPDGGTEIRVSDDGDGIAPHLLTRIFEPHFSTRTSGSGLGLAISRRLIGGWGGEIDARSDPATGTTLRIRLAPPPSP